MFYKVHKIIAILIFKYHKRSLHCHLYQISGMQLYIKHQVQIIDFQMLEIQQMIYV